jgi:solute carrier family 30 (zinc transporter), member 1
MKRQTRIITLLVIDSLFFFVEIIIGVFHCHACLQLGYTVHSLALVADSFHMVFLVMATDG